MTESSVTLIIEHRYLWAEPVIYDRVSLRNRVSETWNQKPGIGNLGYQKPGVSKTWYRKPSIENLLSEAWYWKPCIGNLVSETWYQKPGTENLVSETWD